MTSECAYHDAFLVIVLHLGEDIGEQLLLIQIELLFLCVLLKALVIKSLEVLGRCGVAHIEEFLVVVVLRVSGGFSLLVFLLFHCAGNVYSRFASIVELYFS